MEMLLLSMVAAWFFTRNTVQDLTWRSRGEDPPSYRRELERAKRRADARENPGPARRFWGNAWGDAWARAEERREDTRDRAKERRRVKRAEAAEAEAAAERVRAEDEAYARNADEPTPDFVETVTCGGCGVALLEGDVAGRTLLGLPRCRVCQDAATAEPPHPTPTPVPDPAPKAAPVPGPAAPEPSTPTPTDPETPPEPTPAHHTEPANAEVIDLDWHRANQPTKETPMSETHSLAAALVYTSSMAAKCGAGASGVETTVSSLQRGGVSGATLAALGQAQEALAQAAAAFGSAHSELLRHIAVKEAYAANQGAGTRAFVTSD